MSKKINISLLAVPLTLLSMPVLAQATIIASGTQNLHFGTFASGPSAGTVTINPATGLRTSTGGVTLVSGAGLDANGVISLTASTGINITLSMTNTSFILSNGADTMVVNDFNINTAAAGSSILVNLAATTETFPIGATLQVGANQAQGTYTGNYTVNAIYN